MQIALDGGAGYFKGRLLLEVPVVATHTPTVASMGMQACHPMTVFTV